VTFKCALAEKFDQVFEYRRVRSCLTGLQT
jgi:hypothetical protein